MHAFTGPLTVELSVHENQLRLAVGGTDGGGLSLSHMRDRIEATGGSVSTAAHDGRTRIEVRASAVLSPAGP